MEKEIELVPFSVTEEIRTMLAHIEEQNRVIMEMIANDQVARMATDYLDLEQAANVLHCKAKTLERLRMRGELAFFQYGKKIVIRRADIDAFLEAHRRNADFLKKIESEPQLNLVEEQEDGMEE
jgi:excisionase family DNA binding protein